MQKSFIVAHLNTEKTFRGGEQQTLYLIKGLLKKGLTTYLICNKGSLLKEKASNYLLPENILEVKMKGEFDIIAILKIRNFLKKKNIDLLHCHTSHAHTLGFLSAIGLPVKVIVSRRVDFSIKKGTLNFLNKIKYNFLCDKIVSISEKIKEILINDGINSKKIITIHSGVDLNKHKITERNNLFREFNIPENAIICLNVAALVPHKGHKYLLESFAQVVKKYNNVILFIVGDGKLKKELLELRDRLNLKNAVIFTGYRTDVANFYSIADIFIMTSVEEGLCTSILDALCYNKVVIATDAGGIPEIIKNGETGILVEKENIASITAGIIDAIENMEQYKKKFANVNKFVEKNFSVEKMVEGNLKLYRELLYEKQ